MITKTTHIESGHELKDEFRKYDRQHSFSDKGFDVLFDFLNETDYELDVIGIDCEFVESSLSDVLKDYNLETLEELNDNTMVLIVDNETVIYQSY